MVWARAQKAGSPGAKALLLLLGELANDHAETYRDQQFIADILEVSRETVGRNLKVLAEAGLVTVTKQFDKAGQRRPNLITLHVTNPHIDESQPCDESSHSPCDESSQQYKHSLNKHSSPTDVGEEAPAPPGPVQDALIPAPARRPAQVNLARPEWQVAQWVSAFTNGAWSKHMLAPRVRWMINERGMSQRDAAILLRDMWTQGRMHPTQPNIGRIIDGLITPTGQSGAAAPSTKDARIRKTLAMANPDETDPFQLRITA